MERHSTGTGHGRRLHRLRYRPQPAQPRLTWHTAIDIRDGGLPNEASASIPRFSSCVPLLILRGLSTSVSHQPFTNQILLE